MTTTITEQVAQHIAARQCSPQWRAFLAAIAAELNANLPPKDLSALFARIGQRYAQTNPLPESETLVELQEYLNLHWALADWGWVELISSKDSLQLTHHCSPLIAAFGADSGDWTGAFLSGAYQQWLADAGAGEHLHLSPSESADSWGTFSFRLSQ